MNVKKKPDRGVSRGMNQQFSFKRSYIKPLGHHDFILNIMVLK